MAYRVEVGLKPNIRDARGEKIKRRIIDDLKIQVDTVRTVDVYTMDASLSGEEIERLATGPFLDPVIQDYSLGQPLPQQDFDWAIEGGYTPGVTDNVGRTAREAVEILLQRKLKSGEGGYTTVLYFLKANLARNQAESIATGLLANTLIQRFEIKDRASWNPAVGMGVTVPKVSAKNQARVEELNLQVSDGELMRISSRRVLALSLKEMKALQQYAKDPARLAERRWVRCCS